MKVDASIKQSHRVKIRSKEGKSNMDKNNTKKNRQRLFELI